MPLTDIQDYYNVKGTRNSNNTDDFEYNCGGYALNTFSWYEPYDVDIDIIEEDIAEYIDHGYLKEQIYNILLSRFVKHILKDFKTLRTIKDKSELKSDERLIYFRYFFELVSDFDDNWNGTEDSYDYIHSDFHFRFYENNHWYEKNGSGPIHMCDGEDNDGPVWICGANAYDSPIIKFAMKVRN
jgi:hypothetical protein